MITLADQWSDPAPIEGSARARARKYSTTGQITADCHTLKYIELLAQILAAILSATGANVKPQQLPQNLHAIASTTGSKAQRHQLARISATQHQLLSPAILHHYRQQNHHRQHQESRGRVGVGNQRENQQQLASGITRQCRHQQRRAESLGLSIRNRLARFERLKGSGSPRVGYSYKPR